MKTIPLIIALILSAGTLAVAQYQRNPVEQAMGEAMNMSPEQLARKQQQEKQQEANQPKMSDEEFRKQVSDTVSRCLAAEDACEVGGHLSNYVGKKITVFGFINVGETRGPTVSFILSGGKGHLVGQPSGSATLACYIEANDSTRRTTRRLELFEGFNMQGFALAHVVIEQRDAFPKYVARIVTVDLVDPRMRGYLQRAVATRMQQVR